MMPTYAEWFSTISAIPSGAHSWQKELASDASCRNRLIRIPTGFGKTAGTVLPWLWHRVVQADPAWPARLVFCLPMRVLVEQTEASITAWLKAAGVWWDGHGDHAGKVGVHALMGGCDAGDWHLHPEHPSIILGTQDMLLSRALNRGYASPRARWPMEFGLLNQDCLWVVDEVQLMDVGLATSAQMQAFRHEDEQAGKSLRPCRTWWMSATMQPRWLETVDTQTMLATLPPVLDIPTNLRTGTLWEVRKPREIASIPIDREAGPTALAALAHEAHRAGTLTLVVVNRVDDANTVFNALSGATKQGVELRLVHSRFRPHERRSWREDFLNRSAPMPAAGRIVVATQVVEAGVDISAETLVTDLAPWPSLVQRFGRCARYGGEGRIIVADRGLTAEDDKAAAPYAAQELLAARAALARITDVSPHGLETFEESLTVEERKTLYPYAPKHLLLRRELDELFDTTPDLTGADLDISRYIRSGDERDLQVFWLHIAQDAKPTIYDQPIREELCSVPFLKARDWLCGEESKTNRKPRLRKGLRAWVWDFVERAWITAERSALTPGKVICVDARCGGYDQKRGFDPDSGPVTPVHSTMPPDVRKAHAADSAHNGDELSTYGWKTIACHGGEVAALCAQLSDMLGLPAKLQHLLILAGRWHDFGKAHPAFQGAILDGMRSDLAKAPEDKWRKPPGTYPAAPGDHRRGFRHELASALALFAVLERYRPDHPGLLGDVAEALVGMGRSMPAAVGSHPGPVEQAILDLPDAASFNLVAYLVAAHHGKVRVSLQASPVDQDYRDRDGRGLPIRGVREGDPIPSIILDLQAPPLTNLTLSLDPASLGLSLRTGPSWRERVISLQHLYGPGALAWLEAILIAADRRASQLKTIDPLIPKTWA